MNECIHTLYRAGAGEICIVTLAVNQQGANYWSSNVPQVSCPQCGNKMHLLINSRDNSFFYACYDCRITRSFNYGRKLLEDTVNREYAQIRNAY